MRPLGPDVNQAQTLYICTCCLYRFCLRVCSTQERLSEHRHRHLYRQPPALPYLNVRSAEYQRTVFQAGTLCIYEQHKEKQAHYTKKKKTKVPYCFWHVLCLCRCRRSASSDEYIVAVYMQSNVFFCILTRLAGEVTV